MTTGVLCPHCQQSSDGQIPVNLPDDDAALTDGSVSICGHCLLPGIFDAGALRQPTDAEVEQLMGSPEFEAAMGAALLVGVLRDALHREDDDDDEPGPHVHALRVSYDPMTGEVDGLPEGLPPDVVEELARTLARDRTDRMAKMIRRHVTQEVANHVLSSYGNEDASMPSVTVAALISLIRLCNQADDAMLRELGEVHEFRGYILAVTMLAEPNERKAAEGGAGIKILEQLAGLRDKSENVMSQ